MLVHRPFNIRRDRRGALVEHAVLWQVVEEASHSHLAMNEKLVRFSSLELLLSPGCTHPLLLATGQDVLPLFAYVVAWRVHA